MLLRGGGVSVAVSMGGYLKTYVDGQVTGGSDESRRGDTDRLPGVVAHVVVGRASGGFGAVERVVLHILQAHLGRAQLGFDLRAQIARPFAGLLGSLLEQRLRFHEHVGEILDQCFAAAFEFCGSHVDLP